MKLSLEASFRLKADYQVRRLEESDVNEEYVSWLNEPETTMYLSTVRPGTITISGQKEYVRGILASSNNAILGLFDSNARLIGTSGIQGLNVSEVGPWLGVLIGPRECRGLGLGKALLWIVTYTMFSHLDASITFAGIRVLNGNINIPSYKAFLKIGYRINDNLMKEYNPDESSLKKVVIVSCVPDDLISQESIGITSVHISHG